jgi:hypothetical protein
LAGASVACEQHATVTDLELTPSFAIWDYMVNGGGEMTTGAWTIFIQVSVTDAPDKGTVTGQVEYEGICNGDCSPYDDFKFHGDVDDFIAAEDGSFVNLYGDVNVQEGECPPFVLNGSMRFGIAIDNVNPSGDRMTNSPVAIKCESLYTGSSFPATMVDGDFRVKVDKECTPKARESRAAPSRAVPFSRHLEPLRPQDPGAHTESHHEGVHLVG